MAEEIEEKPIKKSSGLGKKFALAFVILTSVPLLAVLCIIVLNEIGNLGGVMSVVEMEQKIESEVETRLRALTPAGDMPKLSAVRTKPEQLIDAEGMFAVEDYLQLARERNLSLSRMHNLSFKKVAIDPGHGGRDDGVKYGSSVEKNILLDVGLKIKQILKSEYGIDAVMTREDDESLSMGDRIQRAARQGSDLMVSLHMSKMPGDESFPLHSYYFGIADDPNTLETISLINRDGSLSLRNFSDALDVYSRGLIASDSLELARRVHGQVSQVSKDFNMVAVDDIGVSSAPITQLLAADMPAMLLEFGTIANARQASFWDQEANRRHLAEAVASGIAGYILVNTASAE